MDTQLKTGTAVVLPSLGESIDEATITRWLKAPGDRVEVDEPLLEVATDKVDSEIPSPVAGTLVELVVGEGESAAVDAVIAIIGVEGESAKREQSDSTPRPEPTSTPESGQPVVEVRCSDDSAATGGVSDILQTAPVTPTESAQPGRVERLPKIRQTIARRMLESLHTTAQLTTVIEADVTGIARLRAAEKDDFKHRTGTKLSYLPFFVKATVEALNEHPLLNSTINDDATEIAYHDAVHLGIAVDSPKGLIVPVLRNAQHMTIARMATAIAQVATAVRCGPASPPMP